MFNITNKKINTSMISNARKPSISLTLNTNYNKTLNTNYNKTFFNKTLNINYNKTLNTNYNKTLNTNYNKTLNANYNKSKVNNKTIKIVVTSPKKNKQQENDTDTYDYDNVNDIIKYMKQNKNKKYSFVICGVGDFICIDYFLQLKNIHFIFVSKSSLLLKSLLMKAENTNKSNIKHFAVYFDFNILNRPGFSDKNEMFKCLPYLQILNKINKINLVDITLFKHIEQNIISCKPNVVTLNKNNIFLNTTYCDIKTKFNLPDNIMLVCPYTQDNRIDCILCGKLHTETNSCTATRNFTINDYYNTESILKKNKMVGVIVTDGQTILPNKIKDSFIDLSGQTSIEESIEILKACHGYIGIDSFLSVFATKIFDNNNIVIKCYNKHGDVWKYLYWYPFKFTFNSPFNSL